MNPTGKVGEGDEALWLKQATRNAASEIDALLVYSPEYLRLPGIHDFSAVILKHFSGAGLTTWLPIETAPKDEPLWLTGPSLVDEDYNRKGVVEGYWLDDLGWMGAIWNNEQDYWESRQIKPTHWMPIPFAPALEAAANSEVPGGDDATVTASR